MPQKENDSTLKRVLVLGGTSEIGRRIIFELYHLHHLIDFTYFNNHSVRDEIIEETGGASLSYRVDLTDLSSVSSFLNTVAEKHYDSIIYCAGENPCKLCHDLNQDDIAKLTNLNFLSPTLIFTELSKKMAQNKDEENMLIYLSSISSGKASVGDSIYGATKIATERYLASLSMELGRFNVRTLCIAPGFVETKMMHHCREISGTSYGEIMRSIPARKILTTKEVAKTAIFFIKNKNITTGNTLVIGNGEKVF